MNILIHAFLLNAGSNIYLMYSDSVPHEEVLSSRLCIEFNSNKPSEVKFLGVDEFTA